MVTEPNRMTRTPERVAPAAQLADFDLPDGIAPGVWPAERVQCNGVDLNVRHTPPTAEGAQPALMVHGLGGSTLNWTDFAYVLRDHLDSVAIDLPGHGVSGPPPGRRYALADHARTVVAYLEQSGRGAVHLFGNSMGGAISIMVAAQRPDLVRTLTLISPAVPDVRRFRVHPLRHDPRMAFIVVPGIGGLAMKRAARIAAERRVGMTIKLCFADKSRYPQQRFDEDVAQTRERARLPWANESFLRSVRGLALSQFARPRVAWQAMREIKAPSLVVWGGHDRLVAPDLVDHVAGAIPDSRRLLLEDVGHTAQMEDPRSVARAFLAMAASVAP